MSFIIIIGLSIAWFAAVGRQAIPYAERIPLRDWNGRDLSANFLQGLNSSTASNPALEHYTRKH